MPGDHPIAVRGLDHIVLRVADLDAMIAFYGEVLGCRVERRLDDIGLIQLRAGQSLIDLVPVDSKLGREGGAAPGVGGRNLDHLCLRVEPFDEAAIRRHLDAHGVAAAPSNRATAPRARGRRSTCSTPSAIPSSSRGRRPREPRMSVA